MFRGQKVVALIPARGGSKGLPKKNLMSLGGKSLIQRAAESALDSGFVDAVVVSSDDNGVLELAGSIDGVLSHRRSDALSTDTATAADVIHDLISIEQLGLGEGNPWILYLQPTSPFRNASHVRAAFELLSENENRESVISVAQPEKNPYWSFVIDEDQTLKPLFPEATSSMRQDLPRIVLPNGAIYLFSKAEFLKQEKVPSIGALPLEMTREESVDIDTQEDFDKAESILAKQK